MSAVVIQTAFLGDVILTTPLIAALARREPVDVVTTPAAAELLAGNPDVREVIVFDKRGTARGMRGLLRIASRIRAAGPDVAYFAQASVRSAALGAAARVPERVGFETAAGRALYTRRVPWRADRHHAERLWWLGARDDSAAPDAAELQPRLFPGEAERGAVDELLAPLAGEPFACVAPGSVWGTKRWPGYPELVARLASELAVVVVGAAADREHAAAIATQAPAGRVIDATGRLSLLASAELIGRARLLVTNDSAPQHLASAMATPTLTIFGPTVPEFGFGPLAPRSASLGVTDLACRPCDSHGPQRCPLGHWRCMTEQPAAVVAERALALLATAARR